jgi:hypothetical protein
MISRRALLRHRCAGFCLWLGMMMIAPQSFGQSGRQRGAPPDPQSNRRETRQQNQSGDMQGNRRGMTQQNQSSGAQPGRRGMPQQGQPSGAQVNRPATVPPNPLLNSQSGQAGTAQAPNARVIQILAGRSGFMQPRQPDEPATMRMRLEDQDLSAEIHATPLQQVLGELAAWSGIVFEIDSQENEKISVNFYRVSVQEAIQRLTKNDNSIEYYDRDQSGQSRLCFVRIISATPHPSPPTLQYIGTGTITKRSDDNVDSTEQALAVLAGSNNLVARQKAIEVLVASKVAPAVQALEAALNDPAVEIKVAAIEGLVSLGARETLPKILLALKDGHPGVRQSAVLAVATLGDVRNVKDLRPLVQDPDASVAASAEVAIQKLSARRP